MQSQQEEKVHSTDPALEDHMWRLLHEATDSELEE